MYLPPHFREDDRDILHRAMAAAGLATLVTAGPDGMVASHLPLFLDPAAGPNGTLYGHVARANPHARTAGGTEGLVIFTGPDGYVTPSWYPGKAVHGKVVPTWNYVAIHAYGPIETFDDPARLLDVVTRLTERHEAGRARPWAVGDAPADFIAGMLKGIVGFALPIARLEGKWKMSQNRPADDRAAVADGLRGDGAAAAASLVAGQSGPTR